MDRIKIILYDEGSQLSQGLGGGQLARLYLMQQLDSSKFNPVLLTSTTGKLTAEAKKRGVNTIIKPINPGFKRFPREDLLKNPLYLLRTFFRILPAGYRLAAALKELDADILHPNENLSRLVAIVSQFFYKVPSVIHIDNEWDKGFVDKIMGKVFTRRFDRLIAVSEAVRNIAEKYTDQTEKITTIPTGINPEQFKGFDKEQVQRELGINRGIFAAATIGKLIDNKGQHLALKAFKEVKKEGHKFQYYLIGDGPAKEQLQDQVQRLNLSDNISFLGYRNDVNRLLAAFDLLIHPSLTEAFPLTVIEGLMAGKPVIATDVGGTRQILNEGRFGWIVPPGKIGPLRDSILEALQMAPQERNRMGKRGKKYAMENFSLKNTILQTEKVYLSLLGKHYRLDCE